MLRTRWQCRSSSLLKKQQKIGIKERLQQNTRKNKCLGLGSPRNRSGKGSGCKRLKWEGTSGNTGQLNGKTGKRRKEADIKCLIKVGVTGAQSLWRTWGEMVALRICQVKHKEAGVFIHYLPGSTAKSCFSGYLCFGISSSQQQSLGYVPVSPGGSRCGLDSSATVSMEKTFPSLTSYPSSNDRNHSLGNQPHTAW